MTPRLLRFPYVCADEELCTRDKFMNWDVDQGWSWESDTSLPLLAKRLQSWLLFGLVSMYMEEDLPRSRLLTQDIDGREVIDIIGPECRLRHLLREASSRFLGDQDADHFPQRCRMVQNALQHGMVVMSLIVIPFLYEIDDGAITDMCASEWHAVIFGIDLVMDVLCEQVKKFQGECVDFHRSSRSRPSLAAEVRVVRDTISRSGRCPSLAGRLRPLSQAWYDMLLLPPSGVPQKHSECTALHCRLNNVKKDEYQIRHTEACSGCEFLSANPQALVTAIKRDRIPLVCCFLDADAILRFRIVEGGLDFKYTAVSHVWTGGLGNFESNALPSCQIARLWKMVREIPDMQAKNLQYPGSLMNTGLEEKLLRLMEFACTALRSTGNVYFWIDTLCIPVDKELSEHRQTTIASMAQIYAGAETVLVLDTHMQQLQDIDSTHPTFMTHLAASPWMARSWPLQEGAVAPSLCVRLKNKTVILTRSQQKDLLSVSLHHTNSLFEDTLFRNPTYAAVWNALASRGTTQRDDLDGIFATLLNLNAGEILSLAKSSRMKAIISTQESIPFSLMCIPRERHDVEILESSWVPAFPDTSLAMIRLDDVHGSLLIAEDGFVFRKASNSGTLSILVQDLFITRSVLTIEDSQESKRYEIYMHPHSSGCASPRSSYDSLFILTSARIGNGFEYQGCRFEVLSSEDTTMTLKYHTSFRWRNAQSTVPEQKLLKGARFTKLEDPSFRMLIAEDFKNWHKPKWFRLSEYPFTSVVGSESDIWYTATFPAAFTTNTLCCFPVILSMNLDDPILRNFIYFMAFILSRPAYALVQRAFWRLWLAQWIQQRWAATFYDSKMTRKMLSAPSPTLSFMLWTYMPIYCGACILLGFSWLRPAHRMSFIWVALAHSIEPLLSYSIIKFTTLKHRLRAKGHKDPLPVRAKVAIYLVGVCMVPLLSFVVKEVATSFKGWSEKELSAFRVYGIVIRYCAIVSPPWAIVLLYYSYLTRSR